MTAKATQNMDKMIDLATILEIRFEKRLETTSLRTFLIPFENFFGLLISAIEIDTQLLRYTNLENMVAFWFLFVGLSLMREVSLADYVAAVAEHEIYMGQEGDTSESLVEINIQLFENLTSLATRQGAQVVVFPEFGLTPVVAKNRDDLYPFLEVVPNEKISPCLNHQEFLDRPRLLRMSCAAQENQIIILVNIIDKQVCSVENDPNCPVDGHYQFNTDVLFDESGYIVAKYHKSHEWPPFKVAYDQPAEPSQVTYKSSFGVEFGLFICFDIMFEDPAKVLRQNGISHFLYAVAQGDAGLKALIKPWSENNAAVVLASNLGAGLKGDCSGIIVNGVALPSSKYSLTTKGFQSENVLIATVPTN
jgi:predicted amidohydrolase